MELYAASEQVQVSKSVLHEFSQEYHKHAHPRTHTHTHTHKPFYFDITLQKVQRQVISM